MAAARLLRVSRPLGLDVQPPNSFSSSCKFSSMSSESAKLRCFSKGGFNADSLPTGHGHGGDVRKAVEVKASVLTSECALTSETKTDKGVDLAWLLATVRHVLVRRLNEVRRRRPWKLYAQTFIEKGIMDCRFFTLFAVAGSLLGSLLCYVEGCYLILGSYFEYFHALSQGSVHGHLVQLLIEAIDMFLVGTAMMVFGMGLHVLFVGSYDLREEETSQHPNSNYLKTLPSRVGMNSITQAKMKIGHAVVMTLQVGVLEKFKSIPVVTGFDFACFAAAVFMSSACIFLLSKLSDAAVAEREKAG